METPMRVLGIGLAVALGVALVPQASLTADAAQKKVQKGNVQKVDDQGVAWVSGRGGVRGYSNGKKPGGLKAKGSGEGVKNQRRITDCEGSTYLGQKLLGTSCLAK
jgi:hypothetical protein